MDDDKHDGAVDPNERAEEPAAEESTFVIRDDADAESEKKPGGVARIFREVALVVVIVLAIMFVFNQFFFRQYVVPSESMENTLHGCTGCSNDRIVVDRLVYRFSDPEPGDVVVFKAPTSSWDGMWESPRSKNPVLHKIQDVLSLFALAPPDENNLVKRVIATGGQTVECHNADGKGVTVDGKALHEPYIDTSLQAQTTEMTGGALGEGSCYGADFGPVTVPDGNVWVMGDNRSNSADSRFHVEDEYHGTVPIDDIRGKVRFILYPFSRIGGVGAINPQE